MKQEIHMLFITDWNFVNFHVADHEVVPDVGQRPCFGFKKSSKSWLSGGFI
jgi:hypothetical protein